jgi:hypothetical protein
LHIGADLPAAKEAALTERVVRSAEKIGPGGIRKSAAEIAKVPRGEFLPSAIHNRCRFRARLRQSRPDLISGGLRARKKLLSH